jgi:hypothetical protein
VGAIPDLTGPRADLSNPVPMSPSSPRTSPAARPLRLSRVFVALAFCLLPPTARAAVVKPWTPANADSITGLVAEAKVRFRQANTDTITEQSILPFERVGQAARRLYRRLGRENTLFAPSIKASLDSLGLDIDVVNDPELPSVVLVLVRNPYRPSMQAVGYLLWYRGPDLRMQGAAFPPCVQPRLRTWWTGRPAAPYATAIVYHERGDSGRLGFKYLRLSGDGTYWDLVQYEGHGPDLGANGDAAFADLDHDGLPELVAFSAAPPDSILSVEPPVLPPRREAIYTDRGEGFQVHDARIVPGPLATLRMFVSALREGNREQARRLLMNPTFLELALAAGWANTRSPSNFVVDRQEEGQRWPIWLGARVRGTTGMHRWVFHFAIQDGRWLIKDWLAEESPRADAARGASRDSTGGHRP